MASINASSVGGPQTAFEPESNEGYVKTAAYNYSKLTPGCLILCTVSMNEPVCHDNNCIHGNHPNLDCFMITSLRWSLLQYPESHSYMEQEMLK